MPGAGRKRLLGVNWKDGKEGRDGAGSTAWRERAELKENSTGRRNKEERVGGGVGRGALGRKSPELSTLPASINPIKVLKIRSHVKLLT